MAPRAGLAAACALGAVAFASASDLAVCPGEGARYQDFKCNHDPTHRVCAQLLDQSGAPLNWGQGGNFWQITGQEAFQWDDKIRENGGDSWCICMWATATLIKTVGCENVHIDCSATDVSFVESRYTDGGTDLAPAKACLEQKCPGNTAIAAAAVQQASDAALPVLVPRASDGLEAQLRKPGGEISASGDFMSKISLSLCLSALVGAGVLTLASLAASRRQRQQQVSLE